MCVRRYLAATGRTGAPCLCLGESASATSWAYRSVTKCFAFDTTAQSAGGWWQCQGPRVRHVKAHLEAGPAATAPPAGTAERTGCACRGDGEGLCAGASRSNAVRTSSRASCGKGATRKLNLSISVRPSTERTTRSWSSSETRIRRRACTRYVRPSVSNEEGCPRHFLGCPEGASRRPVYIARHLWGTARLRAGDEPRRGSRDISSAQV